MSVRSIVSPRANALAVGEFVNLLRRHHRLTGELTRRELRDRYVGHVLGLVWAVGNPLLLTLLYIFLFAYVFPMRLAMDDGPARSYVVFILAGIIPWLAFSDVMNNAATVIVRHGSLVKQVVFPVDLLPLKIVSTALITQLIATVIMLVYMVLASQPLPAVMGMLPVLILLQAVAMIGVAYLLACLGAYVRDTRDVVQFITTAGLFATPILFVPEVVERVGHLRTLLYLNPFSYLVWCYHDVIYYGSFEHPWAWGVVSVLAITTLCVGYRFFRKFKIGFGEVL